MDEDPLFAGMTRPSLLFGIPSDAFGILVVVNLLAFMTMRNLLVLLAFPLIYAMARLLCAKDPRFFRYLMLWLRTKGRGANRALWGSSSYAPTSFRKR